MLNIQDIAILNPVFRKLLTLAGIRDGFYTDIVSDFATPVIDTATTFYVETTGNDEIADGSINAPFRTIQKAIDYVKRFLIADIVKIKVGIGTFDPFISGGYQFLEKRNQCQVLIEGTLVPVTSGTFTTTATGEILASDLTDSTKNWTIDEHVGRLVKTTVSSSVNYFSILSNTNNTITLTTSVLPTVGTSYEIYDYGTIISGSISTTPGIFGSSDTPSSGGNTSTIGISGNISGQTIAGQHAFRYLSVLSSATTGISSRGFAYFSMINCFIKKTTIGSCLILGSSGSVTLTSCTFQNTAGSGTGITANTSGSSPSVLLTTCGFIGTSSGTAVSLSTILPNSSFSGYFKNWGTAISLTSSSITCNSSFKDCTTCISISNASTLITTGTTRFLNGTTAILATGSARCSLGTTSTITSFTNGVSANSGARIQIHPAVTFSGVTNEISVDGSTSTIASMRANSPKIFPTTPNAYGSYVYE